HLPSNLSLQLSRCESRQPVRCRQFGDCDSDCQQPYQIAQIVITRSEIRLFQIRKDESLVGDYYLQEKFDYSIRYLYRAPEHLERGDQIHRPDARFHRDRPVNPNPGWILLIPPGQLIHKFGCVQLITGQRISSAEHHKVMQAVQLPDSSRVRASSRTNRDTRIVLVRPHRAADRILRPAYILFKLVGASEKTYAVSNHRIAQLPRLGDRGRKCSG